MQKYCCIDQAGKAKGQRPRGSLFKAALAFHTHSHTLRPLLKRPMA